MWLLGCAARAGALLTTGSNADAKGTTATLVKPIGSGQFDAARWHSSSRRKARVSREQGRVRRSAHESRIGWWRAGRDCCSRRACGRVLLCSRWADGAPGPARQGRGAADAGADGSGGAGAAWTCRPRGSELGRFGPCNPAGAPHLERDGDVELWGSGTETTTAERLRRMYARPLIVVVGICGARIGAVQGGTTGRSFAPPVGCSAWQCGMRQIYASAP